MDGQWVDESKSKMEYWSVLLAQWVKNLPPMQKTQVWTLGWEDPQEKEMATQSGILAWRIPWTEEPGGLQSMGSACKDWVTKHSTLLIRSVLAHILFSAELNSPIPVHFGLLVHKMSVFTLAISCFDHFQLALIHGPNIPGSYAILLFTVSDLASFTSHIHKWVLFFLCLHLFILSGVISPLISSSILGTYWPGEFFFQYPIILPFHTVHGVLKARIQHWRCQVALILNYTINL